MQQNNTRTYDWIINKDAICQWITDSSAKGSFSRQEEAGLAHLFNGPHSANKLSILAGLNNLKMFKN